MALIKGMASVFGADGKAVYGPFGTVGPATGPTAGQKMNSLDNTHSADIEELRDENGELIGAAIRNERFTLDVEWVPIGVRDAAGAPVATDNAIDNALQAMTFPGASATVGAEGWTKVAISGVADSAGNDLKINGDYIYREGGNRGFEADAFGRIRLTLEKPLGSPLSVTQLTTTAT